MGAIFAARHEGTGGRLAIKWMLPNLLSERTARERFIREAQLGARIEHPNVVPVFDIGEDRGSLFLVMALLEGESLGARLSRGPLPVEEAVRVVIGALRGVAAAHALGIVHRDLKPDNIFLAKMPDGRLPEPKVLDFGISKVHEGGGGVDLALTGAGALLGTPHYMAEEQVRSAEDVDARADTYALGVILYECLSGRRPFEGESFGDLVLRIATETPPPIDRLVPGLDPALAAITMRAMSRTRAQRFADASVFAEALAPHQLGAITPSGAYVTQAAAIAFQGPPLSTTPTSRATLWTPTSTSAHPLATPTGASAHVERTPFATTSDNHPRAAAWSRLVIAALAVLTVAVIGLGALAIYLATRDDTPATAAGQSHVIAPAPPTVAAPPPSLAPPATGLEAAPPAEVPSLPAGLAPPGAAEDLALPSVEQPARVTPEAATPSTRRRRSAATAATRAGASPREGDEGVDPWADDIGRAWELGDEPDAPRRSATQR